MKTSTSRRLWLVGGLLWSGAAFAGDVTGKIPLADEAEAERVVVYLESAPGRFEPSPTPVKLSQKGARFSPAVLPLLKGTAVDLTNDDRISHSVFSKSPASPFDLGLYARGEQKTMTFDTTGPVEVFCSIHPKMAGTLLVLQNPFFTKPNADGTFALKDVPGGSYQLAVFRLGEPVVTVPVKIPAKGAVKASLDPALMKKAQTQAQ